MLVVANIARVRKTSAAPVVKRHETQPVCRVHRCPGKVRTEKKKLLQLWAVVAARIRAVRLPIRRAPHLLDLRATVRDRVRVRGALVRVVEATAARVVTVVTADATVVVAVTVVTVDIPRTALARLHAVRGLRRRLRAVRLLRRAEAARRHHRPADVAARTRPIAMCSIANRH